MSPAPAPIAFDGVVADIIVGDGTGGHRCSRKDCDRCKSCCEGVGIAAGSAAAAASGSAPTLALCRGSFCGNDDRSPATGSELLCMDENLAVTAVAGARSSSVTTFSIAATPSPFSILSSMYPEVKWAVESASNAPPVDRIPLQKSLCKKNDGATSISYMLVYPTTITNIWEQFKRADSDVGRGGLLQLRNSIPNVSAVFSQPKLVEEKSCHWFSRLQRPAGSHIDSEAVFHKYEIQAKVQQNPTK